LFLSIQILDVTTSPLASNSTKHYIFAASLHRIWYYIHPAGSGNKKLRKSGMFSGHPKKA
jgi:hypothetical protein